MVVGDSFILRSEAHYRIWMEAIMIYYGTVAASTRWHIQCGDSSLCGQGVLISGEYEQDMEHGREDWWCAECLDALNALKEQYG